MSTDGRNYFANHMVAPQILQGTPNYNVEVGEGNNPPGDFFPASYLPIAVSENRIAGSYFVLMPGKVVTLDTNKRITNAGLILEKDTWNTTYEATVGDAAAKTAAAEAAMTLKYSSIDETAGVRDPQSGLVVAADDAVYARVKAAGIDVATDPVGHMRYSALMAPGSDPSDPSTFYTHSYDTGGARAFTRWGYIQVPVVEINSRGEAIQAGAINHRIALYTDGTAPTFYKGGVLQGSMTQKATPALLTSAAGDPTQFAMVGRTIFFNAPVPANYEVRYQPKVDLPFACLKMNYGSGKIVGSSDGANGVVEKGLKDYIMQTVGFDLNGNYRLSTDAASSTQRIGRVLDVKMGSSKDLALVRTYFRDFGLWQEGPGSSTDGRNAILSIANAPKYIVRIAVNYNVSF